MIPTTIYQTVKAKPLGPDARRLQARARALLPDFEFVVLDDADNAAIMAEHFPAHAARFNAIGKGVVRADIARCAYMHAFGGFYLDTDYKVLRNFDFLRENRAVLTVSGANDLASPDFRVCNSFLASEPGYPLWSEYIEHVFSFELETIAENQIEQITGPEGLTAFLKPRIARYQGLHLTPRNQFAPLIKHFGLSYDKSGSPYGAHICWGSWRSKSPIRSLKDLIVRKVTSFV